MDPKANIEEQEALARAIVREAEGLGRVSEEDKLRLAELVLALIDWRRKGGYDPLAESHEDCSGFIGAVLHDAALAKRRV